MYGFQTLYHLFRGVPFLACLQNSKKQKAESVKASEVGWKMVFPKYTHLPILGTYECFLIWQISAGVIKSRLLRWGDYSGLSGWNLNAVTRVPFSLRQRPTSHIQKRQWGHKAKREFEGVGLEARSDEATSRGMPTATRSWNGWGSDFSPEPLEGARPSKHLGFSSVILITDVWPLELWESKFLLFVSYSFCVIC